MGTLSDRVFAVSGYLTSAAVSSLAWHFNAALIPLTLAFPALAIIQRHRTDAAGVALVYYAVASFPVLQISSEYFGGRDIRVGIVLWVIASAILATPWMVLWSRDRNQIPWRLPAALLVITLPPIGIIGWASPLTSAGFLFPGCGWHGVLLTVLACVAIGVRSCNLAVTVATVSLVANLSYEGPRPTRSGWVAVNTNFGRIHASGDPTAEFSVAEQIQRIALDAQGRVMVFPELLLRRWNDATEVFWEPRLKKLRTVGSTILIGAGSASAVSPDEYRNAGHHQRRRQPSEIRTADSSASCNVETLGRQGPRYAELIRRTDSRRRA
jgi:hypothetical protein